MGSRTTTLRPRRGFRRAAGWMAIGLGADLNASWHRFRLLWNRHGQHTVLSGCIDPFSVHRIGQDEAPMKISIASLDTTTLQVFTTLRHDLFVSITGQSEYSSVERQFHFGRIDTWQVNIQFESIR